MFDIDAFVTAVRKVLGKPLHVGRETCSSCLFALAICERFQSDKDLPPDGARAFCEFFDVSKDVQQRMQLFWQKLRYSHSSWSIKARYFFAVKGKTLSKLKILLNAWNSISVETFLLPKTFCCS